ncbi:PIG-L deacetylase family protein [Aurantimonas sp. A3-2-R12]|uniref:PIG-L deacetylase family protein n=1 Tax=Aurantimonas sp. A3-2-R12 TaxID=3114362 RepID=UPI002E179E69|nr:PIG-L deacetylase family protein [Aurantimonas sp. A3-2-R12]
MTNTGVPQAFAAARILVVAPHPDDESLGCGGAIARSAALGRQTHTIFVTDGGASHPGSATWSRERLAAQREVEASNALECLGAGDHPRSFLRLRDADMPAEDTALWREAKSKVVQIVKDFRPDLVLLPWRRDPHRDHRDSWGLVTAALTTAAQQPLQLEYAIWLDELGAADARPRAGEMVEWRLDITSHQAAKRVAVAAHVSQTSELIADDPDGFRLNPATIARLTGPEEIYWQPCER